MIINAGIGRVVYEEGYCDRLAGEMIAESGLQVVKFAGNALSQADAGKSGE
jgi:dCMP deaminase